ncbi:hypothetical protein PFISCL1PPCAC_21353, partial [Pristionchus fissidentatus]
DDDEVYGTPMDTVDEEGDEVEDGYLSPTATVDDGSDTDEVEVLSERAERGRTCKPAAKRPAAVAAASAIAADATAAEAEIGEDVAANEASNSKAVLAAKRSKKVAAKDDKTEGMKCFKCSYALKSVSAYINHLKNTHQVTLDEVGICFKCVDCGNISRSCFHEILKKCPNARFEVVCDDFERAANMCKDKKEKDKTGWMECVKCPHLTKTIGGYRTHLVRKHNTTPEEV